MLFRSVASSPRGRWTRCATKILSDDKVVAVCRELDEPVILVGRSEDFARDEKIVRQVGANIGNGCGRFSIAQSASLLSLASVVLTNDTDMPSHLAGNNRILASQEQKSAKENGEKQKISLLYHPVGKHGI